MNIFVLMPFAPDFDDVFRQIIQTPLEAAGFTVRRADESRGTRNIMHEVIEGIATADLVVADLTSTNPNVYYELGIAHALGKRTILLTQELDDVPFDLRAYRIITYSTHFARVAEAIYALRTAAEGAKSGGFHFGSPVSDFAATKQQGTVVPVALLPSPSSHTHIEGGEEVADVGLLDCVIDVHEGMDAINAVATQMGKRFEALVPYIEATRIKLQGSAKYEPTQARLAVRQLASAMDEYTRWLKPANVEYRQGLARLASGLDNLFAIDLSDFDIPRAEIAHLHEVLGSLDDAVCAAMQMCQDLMETVGSIPRIEKEFNRAKRLFLDETAITGESLQRTSSVLVRAKDGAQRLQDAG